MTYDRYEKDWNVFEKTNYWSESSAEVQEKTPVFEKYSKC